MNPILTIIIPSYNMQQYLDKCLSSLTDDRFIGCLQVLIINDGSKDRTEEIANEYVSRYPGIFELINKENGGHGSVVNVGIKSAKGKYFRILDADDWVLTDNLVKLIDVLKVTEADVVIDEKREIDIKTNAAKFFVLPKNYTGKQKFTLEEISADTSIPPFIMLHTLSIRTDILQGKDISVREGVYYDDIEFIIKSTVNAQTFEFYDIEIYQYLVGNVLQSINYKNYVKNYKHHDVITRELVRYATEFNGNKIQKKYLKKRIRLLINTHLNISLIYNDCRDEGLIWTEDFLRYLLNTNRSYYRMILQRYYYLRLLHLLGFTYYDVKKLNKFRKAILTTFRRKVND